MFGTLGGPEVILILVIALIVFGPRKLPEIGKSMGKMLAEFRKASNDFKRTIEDELEADSIGMRLASDTGYDRAGIERFLEKLDDHSDDESLSLLTKTHPDPDDRLDSVRDAMRRIPEDRRGSVVAAERFRRHVSPSTEAPAGG